MKSNPPWILAGLLSLAPLSSFAAPSVNFDDVRLSTRTESAITPQISALAQGLVSEGFVPGLSVGVVRLDGSSVNAEYAAWGNRTEDGDPTTTDTLFVIGSCSKAFLSGAMGILMDDFASGRNVTPLPYGLSEFTWSTKVQALFPGDGPWKLEDDWASQKASIADLLSHVTGITSNEFVYTRNDTPLSLGQRFRYIKPGYELREQWSYTNLFYIFSSYIISTYSGKTFQEYVKERIFDPLNMTSTTYFLADANTNSLMSQAWLYTGRRIPNLLEDPTSANLIAGAGGVVSSVVDMSKWGATILNGGVDPATNKTIIPSSVYDVVTTAREVAAGNTTDTSTSIVGYGLGWERNSYLGHDVISHDGGIPGYTSSLMILPNDGIAIVALLNTDGPWQDIVPLNIISSVLGLNSTVGLPPADALSSAPSTTSTGANCTNSTIPIERFAGIYVNPAYGNLTFCPPSGDGSSYCTSVLSDFAAINNGTVDQDSLYATSPRVVTHVSMQRMCPSTSSGTESFLLTLQSIYPQGYGRDTTPFSDTSVLPQSDVECVVSGQSKDAKVVGCGWMNSEPSPERLVGTIQERADVWWEKL